MKTVTAWVPSGWPMPGTVRWRRGIRMPTGPGYAAMLLAELGRALEAERRYHALKHGGAAIADRPRRIFEEFYAGDRPPGES